jgi:uncharacterized protein (TIGR00255 family)
MITSMTGFCQMTEVISLVSGDRITVMVEIKSLNTRYFEVLCKLPSALSQFELEWSALLKKSLYRGKLFFSVKVNEEVGVFEIPALSVPAAEQYLTVIKNLQQALDLSGALTIHDVMQLPGLLSFEKKSLHADDYKKIENLIQRALDGLLKERIREGDVLKTDLLKRFTLCKEKIKQISTQFEALMIKQKELITTSLQQVQEGVEGERAKLDDLYVGLNKMDINEEIARFSGHLVVIFSMLDDHKHDEKGRKLDFLLQELFREINTITAKCVDATITTWAVDIKVEIEKAREQVQNIV